MRPAVVQDSSRSISYSASWKRYLYVNASAGSTHYAGAAGAHARLSFTGRGIALVAPYGTTRGSARIYIDGVYRGTISLRSSINRNRGVAWSLTFATVKARLIEIRVVGNGRVDVDAFVILR